MEKQRLNTSTACNFVRSVSTFLTPWAIFFSAHAAAPSAEDLFRDPVFSQAALSPDGRNVAMLVASKETRIQLAVLDLETLKPRAVGGDTERDVKNFQWVNDKRLIYDFSMKLVGHNVVEERPGLFAVGVQADGARQLVDTTRRFVSAGAPDERLLDTYYFPLTVPGFGMEDDVYLAKAGEVSRRKVDYFEVLRVNTLIGRSKPVDLPVHSNRWVLGNDGLILAVNTNSGSEGQWQFRQRDGTWVKAASFDRTAGDGVRPVFQAADGSLYGLASHGGFNAVFIIDKSNGRPQGSPILAVPGFDVEPKFIANDKQLLGIRFDADAEVTLWLDAGLKDLQASLDRALPGTINRLSVPLHGDSPWILVQSFSDAQAMITRVFNRNTRKLTRLGEALPGLDVKSLGRTEFSRIKARDGQDLPVYLTLPPGGGKRHPTVILVHGGPWIRGANWQFDSEVQFLASRGYAVLQPAFRGSLGFGTKHFQSGFGQWGRAMQDDLMDALRWSVEQGHTDPQRVCIAGASYGGYAALMGLARDGGDFRCAVAWIGVTDPLLLFDSTWSDITEEVRVFGLNRMLGDPDKDALALKAVSPLHQAHRITKPLLLAYGAWDTRVSIAHGERLRSALKPFNPEVEWIVYKDEGHGWGKPENRFDFWNRVEKFLARNLNDKPRVP